MKTTREPDPAGGRHEAGDRVPAAGVVAAGELARRSIALRRRILTAIHRAGAGHTGGSLSCVDILNVLYNGPVLRVDPRRPEDPDRDRFVHSKGHSVEALYAVLADRGFFPDSELDGLGTFRSPFVGHPTRKVPGIEQNTGALGHGLSFAVGAALGARRTGRAFRVFVLVGDGELVEGSNWEAILAAAHHGLGTLTAIVDWNGLQITGRTRDVCATEPIGPKFEAFGWRVREVDGHDHGALRDVLLDPPAPDGRPTVVIAHTVKGKGVSFMEGERRWHHGVPDDAQLAAALAELDAAEAAPDAAAPGPSEGTRS